MGNAENYHSRSWVGLSDRHFLGKDFAADDRCSITGLAIASLLPRDYSVTIVARNHPGDPDSLEWASPWAGAIWMPLYESDERELLAQLNTLKYLMELSVTKPESSVRVSGFLSHTSLRRLTSLISKFL